MKITYNAPSAHITTGTPVVKEYVEVDPYTGQYEFTPTQETQILNTQGKRLTQNVTIKPIPSNYGKITWDGSALTVS